MKKVWQKVAIGKFATFLTPFQASSTKICLQVNSSHFSKKKKKNHLPQVFKCPALSGLRIFKIQLKSLQVYFCSRFDFEFTKQAKALHSKL
jgi:hypothetical protein